MPLVSAWKPSDPIQILIFGMHKLGKSWGAFTFPRPVVLDYDKGIATARNLDFVKKYGMRQIYYEQFTETRTGRGGVPTAHNAFDDSCRYFDEWMKPKGKWTSAVDGKSYETGRDMFDTWIVDSGTTLSEFASTKAVILLGSMGLSKTQEQGVSAGLVIPKKQDYGAERSMIEQFIDQVKTSGKNVVVICHEKQIMDGDATNPKVTDIVPLLTGKSSQSVPLKFDEVYNLRIKPQGPDMIRYLQTAPDALRRVGSRYGIPNETLWDYDSVRREIDRIHVAQNQPQQEKK